MKIKRLLKHFYIKFLRLINSNEIYVYTHNPMTDFEAKHILRLIKKGKKVSIIKPTDEDIVRAIEDQVKKVLSRNPQL